MFQTLPVGLLSLALELEPLLVNAQSFQSTEAFLMQWRGFLLNFDQRLTSLPEVQSEEAFVDIPVCGNCYAVCRKLENILRHSDGVIIGDRVFNILQLNASPPKDASSDDEATTLSVQISDYLEVSTHHQVEEVTATVNAVSQVEARTGYILPDVEEDEVDDFLVPVYGDEFSATPRTDSLHTSGLDVSASTKPDSLISTTESGVSDPVSIVGNEGIAVASKVNLRQYYGSIAAIFAVSHSEIRPK
jgi:hypothetical protein